MAKSSPIDIIFVPQGPELKAVQQGIRRAQADVALFAIPMGPGAVSECLEQWRQTEFEAFARPTGSPSILLMGLCGSVLPTLKVGDWVVYGSCTDDSTPASVPLQCDAALMMTLQERLGDAVTAVTAVTCDRLIHRAVDKQALAQRYDVQVVDMEGYAFLKVFEGAAAVGMLRVVSDDAGHDLPDLSAAMTDAGGLNPVKLGLKMATQPFSAFRLIQGSLKGLKQLEDAAARLFMD